MKTRERSAAGGTPPGMPASTAGAPGGERLPVARRERKPALAALAVLLILVGALGATVLVMRAGDRVGAVKLTKAVAAGGVISQDDITEVMVADDPGVLYVKWSQRGVLSGYHAQTDLVAGTVLVGQMLGEKTAGLAAGRVVVGLSLTAGQFPPGLKAGDTVAVYRVSTKSSSTDTTGTDNAPIAAKARVASIPVASGDDVVSSGNSQFSVIVDQDEASALTQAAAAGEAALVLLPGSGN